MSYNMYEYKIFEAPTKERNITVLNALLESLCDHGWEPVEVDTELMQILAKRLKNETLLD